MTTFERMQNALRNYDRSGRVQVPDPASAIVPDPDALLTFAVWGDPQIAAWSPLRSVRLLAACRDIGNMQSPLDALILVGDIAENGMLPEYQTMAKLLRGCSDGFSHLLCVSGNHDVRFREYQRQLARFNRFVSAVPGGIVGDDTHYYHKAEINGYTFLCMGTDRATFEGAYISPAQLDWLDRELDAALEKGKPVFVINHQTLPHVNGLPVTWLGKGDWRGTIGWESGKVRRIFEKNRNIIFITGHLHYGTSSYTYEDCGAFQALSVPTVGVVNHGDYSPDTQGYVVSVYKDKILARARIFGEGKYVPETVPGAIVEMRIR